MIYINAQSLVKNLAKIQILAEKIKPRLIFCSETCVTSDILDSELEIENYNIVRCNSYSRHTGGTITYLQKSLLYDIIHNKNYENNTWCLSVEVKSVAEKGVYTCIYHSPSTSDARCMEILYDICDKCTDLFKSCVILGDFNIDMSKTTTYSVKLNQLMLEYGLKQIVNFNTRITSSSRTQIDLLYTNDFGINCKCLLTDIISDHETIQITKRNNVQNTVNTSTVEVKRIVSWKHYSKQNLQYLVQHTNWQNFYNLDLHGKLKFVCNTITSAVERLIERKYCIVNTKIQWFSNHLRRLQKEKSNAYCKAILSNNESDFVKYKEARNLYNKEVEKSKNMYYKNKLSKAGNDNRKMWKCLNSIISGKSNQQVTNCIVFENNISITDISTIATNMNKYFIESVSQICNSIASVPEKNVVISVRNEYDLFYLRPTNVLELSEIVKTFKNKSNKDDLITARVLKDSFDIVGYFFVTIINESFLTSIVPSAWKLSKITPIPKIPNTNKCANFRPINVLPIHEKLIECIVHKQLTAYLESRNCLINVQSGFRKNHSCETALNLVLASWIEDIEKGNNILAVFLDFKRAFETICRETLLRKLKRIGFSEMALNWTRNYLSDRYQQTTFKSATSEASINTNGVPQGSVLGPLLFILYINDIDQSVKHCKINLFADDTLLTLSSRNIATAVDNVNSDLSSLSYWLKSNKLKLNIEKSKFMIVTLRKIKFLNINVQIDGSSLERVTAYKYLGVILNDKLSFSEHVNHIVNTISSKIGVLYRAQNKLDIQSKLTVYKSFIQPHLNYCSSILFLCTKCDIKRLQIQQNKIMRLILKCKRDANIQTMLDKLNWPSVYQLILINVFILIYKVINNMLPRYLSSYVKYVHQCHDRNLRNRHHIRLPNRTKRKTQNSIFYKGVYMYNSIPLNIKTLNFKQFKIKIIEYVKNASPHYNHC